MMRHLYLSALIIALAVGGARGDGTTDFVLDPGSTRTIAAAGSYRLAADVTMTSDLPAITISAEGVTIDLNGHTITGPAGSTKAGISGSPLRATLLNGTVKGFGAGGVLLGDRAVLRGVRVEACVNTTNYAVTVGGGSVIEGCIIANNSPAAGATAGINAGEGCRVAGNVIENNQSATSTATGIIVGNGSEVIDNVVRANNSATSGSEGYGILGASECVIRGNSVINNDNSGTGGESGIVASSGCTIADNIVSEINAAGGSVIGIQATVSKISGNNCINLVAANGPAFGISAGSNGLIEKNLCNTITSNGAGFVSAGISGGTQGRVEGNQVINAVGSKGWGYRFTSAGNFVADNFATNCTTAGSYFGTGQGNRSERNRYRQTTGIDTVNGFSPASAGAGDLADLAY